MNKNELQVEINLQQKLQRVCIAFSVAYAAGWFKSWDYLSDHAAVAEGLATAATIRIERLTDLAHLVATISGIGIIMLFAAFAASGYALIGSPPSLRRFKVGNAICIGVLVICALAYTLGIVYAIYVSGYLVHRL